MIRATTPWEGDQTLMQRYGRDVARWVSEHRLEQLRFIGAMPSRTEIEDSGLSHRHRLVFEWDN